MISPNQVYELRTFKLRDWAVRAVLDCNCVNDPHSLPAVNNIWSPKVTREAGD